MLTGALHYMPPWDENGQGIQHYLETPAKQAKMATPLTPKVKAAFR